MVGIVTQRGHQHLLGRLGKLSHIRQINTGFWCGEKEIVHLFDGFFMNLWVRIGLGLLLCSTAWSTQVYVFLSFSMPEQLMSEMLNESAALHIPAVLNGLIANSMPETVKKIQTLSKSVPNLNLQIDPTAFERFGIKQVPALVVDNGKAFDVLYGNLSIQEGLLKMAGHGDSGLLMIDVRRIIGG